MGVTLQGNPILIAGSFPQKGDVVADFELTDNNLEDIALNRFAGKRKILNIFPSIDTAICAMSVRKFNQEAANLNNTVVLCISADLPFAQGRFCGAEGIENVSTLSSFRHPEIAERLGVKIASGPMSGLLSRAVIVLDEQNRVLHGELVAEIKSEPDYAAAIAALS